MITLAGCHPHYVRSCTNSRQVVVLGQKTFQPKQLKDKRCKYLPLIKTKLMLSTSLCRWDTAGRKAVRITCSPCGVGA